MSRRALGTAVAVAALLTACGGNSNNTGSKPRTITVFAAASLTNAFAAEAAAYTKQSGVHVRFSFAGSQDLVAQLNQGAPADAVATADTATLGKLTVHLSGATTLFARNRLVIVTAPGNPKHIRSAADLAKPSVVVVLAAPTVPAGKYAVKALQAAHVTVHPKSLEDNVRGVLTKVELGEADAGIVYVTDAQSAGAKVGTVALPTSPIATYPAAAVDAAGQGFVDFLTSPAGQAILARFGFLPPR
ncbi:MAG: molybdate transport system substrate-binding protein [Frankiaceae bacterium]|jgi:molybdate transport system substrate-binding protein|nr:molybdate transport system substrate-binding protein [Frankiaceae bacterium]